MSKSAFNVVSHCFLSCARFLFFFEFQGVVTEALSQLERNSESLLSSNAYTYFNLRSLEVVVKLR